MVFNIGPMLEFMITSMIDHHKDALYHGYMVLLQNTVMSIDIFSFSLQGSSFVD